jgi:hypothetical protein
MLEQSQVIRFGITLVSYNMLIMAKLYYTKHSKYCGPLQEVIAIMNLPNETPINTSPKWMIDYSNG